MMETDFHFMLEALFFLRYLDNLSGYVEKRLDKKAKVNFKIYDLTDWTTSNCNMHIAHYPKSKDNQAIKFGQLIEYNMRNIFLEKSYTKCGGEANPRLLHKKIKIKHISGSTVGNVFFDVQVEVYQNILKLRCRPFAFTF